MEEGWDLFEAQIDEGIDLFNRQQFYECHQRIEDIWLQESSDQQPCLQGIIQAAVAFHHYQHGKLGAARALLGLALKKLENHPATFRGLKIQAFRRQIGEWKNALDRCLSGKSERPLFPYPQIERDPG
ncbi:MAG: DUF309 domain-containing protein [Acidobacteriota bacterium]